MQAGNGAVAVHKFDKARSAKKPKEKRERKDPKPADRKCYRCLGDHDQKDCTWKKEVCHHCKKKGYIRRACKALQKETQGSQPHVNLVEDTVDDDDDLYNLGIHEMGDKGDVIWVTPTVAGKPLKMELDTGSAISAIPYKPYKEKFSHVKLQDSRVTFKTYTGEKVAPKGKLNCMVKMKDQASRLDLQVIDTPGPALFGRDWLSVLKLDWGETKALKLAPKQDANTQSRVDQLVEQYKSVFENTLGTLRGQKADIKVEENCQSSFHKARPVPYALRPKVEAELARLQREGILSPVDHSDWATPIVPVVKRDGSVRICGDFKVSVNPVLIAEQYPLPRIEDIFANLSGGKHFSKLDLRQAYHQMEVTEESKKYLTINTHKGLFQYNHLVFGVTSSPAIWQRAIGSGVARHTWDSVHFR